MNRVAVPPTLSPAALNPPVGPVVRMGGPTMGVSWSAQLVLPAGADGQAIQAAVHEALNDLIGQMSGWEPDSDLCRFNDAADGTWLEMPRGLLTVLDRALHWAAESDGAFDPTLGRLTDLWGFGSAGPRSRPVAGRELDGLWSQSGWRRLERRGDALLQPGGLALDLSGIAKGYGVDLAAETLVAAGVSHFLVEIGGELRGDGVRPDGQPWWVAIETPPGMPVEEPILVALHGVALATSGDYRRFSMDEGRRRSHTIDPRTGAPVEQAAASVSVVAATCMDADALCTLLSVLGPDDGMAWASERQVAAYWQLRGEPERMTPAFAAMLED
ncbi:MAG TPA: FAD:protein FMN transferase [Caulobacter sp.]|nr:FAD:protein FMN transferase [Caulobacter sp.]